MQTVYREEVMNYLCFLPDKVQFSGVHKIDNVNAHTKLKLLRDYDIIISEKGNIDVVGSMGRIQLNEGEALLVMPGKSVQISIPDTCSEVKIWTIHYSCEDVSCTSRQENIMSYLNEDSMEESKQICLPEKTELGQESSAYQILELMLEEYRFNRPKHKEMLSLYIRALLYEIYRSAMFLLKTSSMEFPTVLTNRYVRKTINYLHENYTKKVKISDIEELLKLNYNYANTLFKAYTGSTIMKYIDNIRMTVAKEFLMNTAMNLDDIAQQVGINDGNYLSKKFKQREGMSPQQFRDR